MSISMLDDPEVLALIDDGPEGREALAAFFFLVLAAKSQRNGGRFKHPIRIIAKLTRWPVDDLERAIGNLEKLVKTAHGKPWIIRRKGELVIRSFAKWNATGWGGARDGAGRKSRRNQDDNQDGNQDDFKPCASASVSVSVAEPVSAPGINSLSTPACLPTANGHHDGLAEECARPQAMAGSADIDYQKRLIRAHTKLVANGLQPQNHHAAMDLLRQLPDPLGFVTDAFTRAKRQNVKNQIGYVYAAIKSESQSGDGKETNGHADDAGWRRQRPEDRGQFPEPSKTLPRL
jgi:hypothetical protein